MEYITFIVWTNLQFAIKCVGVAVVHLHMWWLPILIRKWTTATPTHFIAYLLIRIAKYVVTLFKDVEIFAIFALF